MPEVLRFSEAEKAAFRSIYAPNSNAEQWALFINECERRQLVPGVHVVFQLRSASEWSQQLNRRVSVQKVTLITTINALRLIADRSGKYEGHGPFVYHYGVEGGDLKESRIPLGKIPHAVSVEGFRKDWRAPLFTTARYEAYAQMKDDGGTKVPTAMWAAGKGRGEEQLAKCCEALMLRTIAPEECAGLLISEELGNDIDKQEEAVAPVEVPKQIIAPVVNQEACSFMTLEAPPASELAKV